MIFLLSIWMDALIRSEKEYIYIYENRIKEQW